MYFDVIIRNGLVIDGTGCCRPIQKDIAILNGVIKAVDRLTSFNAAHVIDASGMMVCPGFIDVHSHNDLVPFMDNKLQSVKLKQGVTTELAGQCGIGPAPYLEARNKDWKEYARGVIGDPGIVWNWETFRDYINDTSKQVLANNYAFLVTHGAVRAKVMGLENRTPAVEELNTMGKLVEEAMEAGAYGLSLGLQYLPGIFSTREELKKLFASVGKHQGIIMVHLRNHSHMMLDSIEEVIKIALETGTRLHVSHMRSYKRHGWGKRPEETLPLLHAANKRGLEITFDQHFYLGGSTLLTQLLPQWATQGGTAAMVERLQNKQTLSRIKEELGNKELKYAGWDDYATITGWENIIITSVNREQNKSLQGKTIAEIASMWGVHPVDAAAGLLVEEQGGVGIVMLDIFSEQDIEELMKSPYQMVGSDSIPTGVPHPRLYGNFPLYIGKYVRDKKILPIEEAIHKATLLPARLLGLKDRGILQEGKKADIAVFDFNKIMGFEDYLNPTASPKGIKYVLVDGQVAVQEGTFVGGKHGQVL